MRHPEEALFVIMLECGYHKKQARQLCGLLSLSDAPWAHPDVLAGALLRWKDEAVRKAYREGIESYDLFWKGMTEATPLEAPDDRNVRSQ